MFQFNTSIRYPINGEPGPDLQLVNYAKFEQYEQLDNIRDIFGGGMINGFPEPQFIDDVLQFG